MNQPSFESTPTVAIIMSAYNAEPFIRQQVDSILAQKDVDLEVWIRDDGSTDDTLAVLLNSYRGDERVHVTSGPNLGATQSFIEAIFSYPRSSEFVGLADADDVWLPHKCIHSINSLKSLPSDLPAAVSTRMTLVDEDLHPIALTRIPSKPFSFDNALVQTMAGGAASLMNRAAYDLLRQEKPRTGYVTAHDTWVYLVVTAFGEFLYMDESTLLWRQHGNNVSQALSKSHSYKARWRSLTTPSPRRRQAREFSRIYGHLLDPKRRATLAAYENSSSSITLRARRLFRSPTPKQSRRANVYHWFLVLAGRE